MFGIKQENASKNQTKTLCDRMSTKDRRQKKTESFSKQTTSRIETARENEQINQNHHLSCDWNNLLF